MSGFRRIIRRAAQEGDAAAQRALTELPERVSLSPAAVDPASIEDEKTAKDRATVETLRALKECYPDRWQQIWRDLGKESTSDRAVASLEAMAKADPTSAAAAAIGAIVGTMLAKAGRAR